MQTQPQSPLPVPGASRAVSSLPRGGGYCWFAFIKAHLSLREKLIKIGAKVVSHGRYITVQMAEVAVSRQMFNEILSLIARLRAPSAPA
jgi:hypothetical protein